MERLGKGDRITAPLEPPALMHAVGQGALAVEARVGDAKTRDALRAIGHWQTEWAVAVERGLLRELEGGCSVPVGVQTTITEVDRNEKSHYPDNTFPALTPTSPTLHFSGLLAPSAPWPTGTPELNTRRAKIDFKACVTSTDGKRHVVYEPGPVIVGSWREAQRWGEDCAKQLRTLGAGSILDDIEAERQAREAQQIKDAQAK